MIFREFVRGFLNTFENEFPLTSCRPVAQRIVGGFAKKR
jgi:hypothetical protein